MTGHTFLRTPSADTHDHFHADIPAELTMMVLLLIAGAGRSVIFAFVAKHAQMLFSGGGLLFFFPHAASLKPFDF